MSVQSVQHKTQTQTKKTSCSTTKKTDTMMPDINVLNETDSKLPPVPESPLSTQVSEPFTTGNNAAVTSCLLIPPLHSYYSGFLIIVVILIKLSTHSIS